MMLLLGLLTLPVMAAAGDQGASPIYITDMSPCQPPEALARQAEPGRWQLISYETAEAPPGSGTMLGAASFVEAPDVTLPLHVDGWQMIQVGIWNPFMSYDGGTTVKVKLSDDPCFTRLTLPDPPPREDGKDYWSATHLREVPFKAADLTGRSLQLGKVHGPFGQKAYIAYIKLTPLSAQQVTDLLADRARKDTRRVCAVIDGISYFWSNTYRTKEHILELLEPYRHADIGRVLWAVNYGDVTNYPAKTGTYYAAERALPITMATNNPHIIGEQTACASLNELASKGVIPEAVAADQAHALGLQFDVMFRLAILGTLPSAAIPLRDSFANGFVRRHPQFRMVAAYGRPVEKASYAFPEVRQFMLSMIREAAETFAVDGVSLGFVRGPEFMGYEQPVLDDFRAAYGADGRNVPFDDPRLRAIRCRYLTEFVGDVRQTLDDVGTKKGRRLALSAWVFESLPGNLDRGLDVEDWMKRGWLDSAISYSYAGHPPDPALMAAAKAYKCPLLDNVVGGEATALAKRWASSYALGVEGFAVWDTDSVQDSPALWPVIQRGGHRQEIEAATEAAPVLPLIKLKTVGGYDVLWEGLQALYSGG
jgi:hypothetical protein